MRHALSGHGDGASVDTVLRTANVTPGGPLEGQVLIETGSHGSDLEFLSVSLVGAIVGEDSDGEYEEEVELAQIDLTQDLYLEPAQQYALPFVLQMPWDTPLTHLYGERLDGMELGLRTDLGLFGERDQGDLDELRIHALPAQEAIFEALQELGFRFNGAELEIGELAVAGVHQSVPCFQEIEFSVPDRYAAKLAEVDLTFVAGPHAMEVLLALGRRGGLLQSSGEELQIFTVEYPSVERIDWPEEIHSWILQATKARGIFF
nr:sporulation protein [Kibdelosporangium sp. MJ126-NF4]